METENCKTHFTCRLRHHIQGLDTAPVTLVEYGDYECPYCGDAYPIIKQVQKNLSSKLRFIFRNFPITPNSSSCSARLPKAAEVSGAK